MIQWTVPEFVFTPSTPFTTMTAWRTLFSFNKYAQITARALRASLKEEERLVAEKRGSSSVRFQKWENGVGGPQVVLKELSEKK